MDKFSSKETIQARSRYFNGNLKMKIFSFFLSHKDLQVNRFIEKDCLIILIEKAPSKCSERAV